MDHPKIIFPVFQRFANETSDPFWVTHFTTMAKGVMPFKNIFFKGDSLLYKTKKRTRHFSLESPGNTMLNELKAFFLVCEGIMSPQDRQALVHKPVRRPLDAHRLPTMIQSFVYNNLKIKYALDPEEVLFIATNIPMAFSIDLLQNKDVVVDPNRGVIVSIDGLDEDYFILHRRWRINPDLQTNKSSKRSIRSDTRVA